MSDTTVTPEQLANYLRNKGKVGAQTRSILGKQQPFMEAIQSKIGQEILKDAITLHEALLMKVAELQATPEETMEYKAYRKIIQRWVDRIVSYEKNLAEITK